MENNNSVAFIAKIKSISPIEGADKIELATIEGWTSVVQKDVHTVGDLILCITTDAVIPEDLATQWNVINYLRKGNRVRTVKLKGIYSECILIPLYEVDNRGQGMLGSDMMITLGIFKYEPPVIITQDSTGRKHKYHQNPNFHIYYKFPNIKNTPNMFDELDIVEVSLKIHGTNARYGIVKKNSLSLWDKIRRFFGNQWIEYEYVYGSHNVEKGSDSQGFYSTDVWKTIAEKYNIKEKLWKYIKEYFTPETLGSGFTLYGEIFGPGIQGDNYTYGRKEISFEGFNIELNGNYLSCALTQDTIKYQLDLPYVTVLYYGHYDEETIKALATNSYIPNTKTPHEGIVIKEISGRKDKIAKIINPEYHIFSEKNNVPDSH